MQRILVICGAGMTSSILVSKMREAAAADAMDYKIGSCATNQAEKYVPQADIVFIAPHLSYMLDSLKEKYEDQRFILITSELYGKLDGKKVLALIDEQNEENRKISVSEILGRYVGGSAMLRAVSSAGHTLMPVLIIGSMFTLVCNFPFEPYLNAIAGTGFYTLCSFCTKMSLGMISVYMTFLVAYNYGNLRRVSPEHCGLNALICFFLLMHIRNGELPLKYLDASGLFCALITAFLSAHCFILLSNVSERFTRNLKSVPPAIYNSFFSLIPLFVSVFLFACITGWFAKTPYGTFPEYVYSTIQQSISDWMGSNIVSVLIANILAHVLWFFGIHGGQVVGAVVNPVMLPLSMQNLAAFQAGQPVPNIINQQFRSIAIFGGAGSTLPLTVLMVMFSKSAHMKQIGRVSLPMGIFFINEPVILGLPIMMNSLLLIPFILIPTVSMFLTYAVMTTGIVPPVIGFELPWTTPIFISGMVQGGWRLAVWQLMMFVMQTAMWYPFFKIQDAKYFAEEKENRNDATDSGRSSDDNVY